MNTEEDSMGGKQRQATQQTTMMLPYFDEEVPVLYLAYGMAYLPVRSLCRMLGLRAETHIPRWRKLVLWASARKLPLQTARGQRIVWCLHLGALPFWCACFNWSLVSAERREQLRQATDAWQEDVAQAQRLLLERYRALRRFLFAFLQAYNDAETWLDQWVLHLSATLEVATSHQLELLLSQEKHSSVKQRGTHARYYRSKRWLLLSTWSRSTRTERRPRQVRFPYSQSYPAKTVNSSSPL